MLENDIMRMIKTLYGLDQSNDEPDLKNRKLCPECGVAFGLRGSTPMRRIKEGVYKHERC